MAAMLRLGSRDRSSFLFRKPAQQGTDGTSAMSVGIPGNESLPTITHIDTRSFVGLFDHYQNTDSDQTPTIDHFSHAPPSAKDFAWPVASPLHFSSVMPQSSSMTRATPLAQTLSDANTQGLVVRNDSTGSSSIAVSRRSDDSPPITRNSSSSSIMHPSSPLQKVSHSENDITAIPDVAQSLNSPYKLKARASTWGSSTSKGIDLDKPLPPLHNPRSKHRSQQDLVVPKSILKNSVPSKYPSLRRHNRSTSFPITLPSNDRGSIPDLPTSRGARLGRAMARPGSKERSKSVTLIDTIGCSSKAMKHKPFRQSENLPVKRPPVPSVQGHIKKQNSKPISSRAAEEVIYRIMCQLDDVRDLRSTALVSKGFFNTYLRNESKLVSHLIFKTSRPAWELRRSILALRGSKDFRLRGYMRDLRTIKALKAFILDHCSANLKAKTIAGLTGQDQLCENEAENALWRIWTFCALFGENAAQASVPPAEIDWLNGSNGLKSKALGAGFAVGNGPGLSADELEDLMEMWTCLQALLSQFHGRENDARRVGVLDNWHADSSITQAQHVQEWTAHLLTLGPQVVLSLCSGSFDRAKMFGLTHWTLPPNGQTRSMFLSSAISHVYQERILAEATARAAEITLPRMSSTRHRPSKSMDFASARQQSLRLDTAIVHQRPVSVSIPRSAQPAEIRPDCDPTTSMPPMPRASSFYPASPTNDPTFFHTLSMTATISTKLGATLFPVDYNQSLRSSLPAAPTRAPPPPPPPASGPSIVDPVDRHMDLLVRELGFNEHKAKRALAMSDTGSGIDVQQAIELLMIESRHEFTTSNTPIELPTPISTPAPLRIRRQKKDICTGECSRTNSTSIKTSVANSRASSIYSRNSLLRHHSRSKSSGNTPITDDVPISPITDIYGGHSDSDDNTIVRDDASEIRRERLDMVLPLMATPIMSSVRRIGTKKAWRVLGVSEQDPLPQQQQEQRRGVGRSRSKSSGVVDMEEYERRIERRKSQRLLKQAGGEQGGLLRQGLGENLKGLGLGGLGGLGGLRDIMEREGVCGSVSASSSVSGAGGSAPVGGRWMGRWNESGGGSGSGSGSRVKKESGMPVTPC